MTALKLTYQNAPQFQYGSFKRRQRNLVSAYSGKRADNTVMNANARVNTYVNYPNKSQEILKKKQIPQSKILQDAQDPRIPQPIDGLSGTLKTQMESFHPFNSMKSLPKLKKDKSR